MNYTRCILTITCILYVITVGCIPVDDLGPYWNQGTKDPQLKGFWKLAGVQYRSEDQFLAFVSDANSYSVKRFSAVMLEDTPACPARTLKIGSDTYLMLNLEGYYNRLKAEMAEKLPPEYRDSNTVSHMEKEFSFKGAIIRYRVDHNDLILYTINEQKLSEAISAGKLSAASAPDKMPMGMAVKLDAAALQFLSMAGRDETYWRSPQRFVHIADIKKVLLESRTYPATTQTPANTLIDVNIPDLAYFAQGKTDVLLQMLAALPDWRVVGEGNDIVCYEKTANSPFAWNDGFASDFEYTADTNSAYQAHAVIRFAKKPFSSRMMVSGQPNILIAKPTAGKLHLKLMQSSGGIESYLAVGQENLWFEFYEQSRQEARTHTRDAVTQLKKLLADIRKAEPAIQKNGIAENLMPSDSVRHGSPTIEIKEDAYGNYRLSAWINPLSFGHIYFKIFDANTHMPLEPEQTRWSSKQYVGFCKDPSTLLKYQTVLPMNIRDANESRNIAVELWFSPKTAATERKLLQTTVAIAPFKDFVPSLRYTGRIINGKAEPVQGATVQLYGVPESKDSGQLLFKVMLLGSAATDNSGVFSFEAKVSYDKISTTFVAVQRDGYAVGWGNSYGGVLPSENTITLSAPAAISGKIVNKQGMAIANAAVHLVLFDKNIAERNAALQMASSEPFTVMTDGMGRFVFKNVPHTSTAEFIVVADGYRTQCTSQRKWPDKGQYEAGADDIVLTMEIGATVTGTVVDEAGKPAANILVLLQEQRPPDMDPFMFTTTSKQDGTFQFRCPAGGYLVYLPTIVQTGRFAKAVKVAVKDSQSSDVTIRMSKAAVVEASITDASGQPVPQAMIYMRNNDTGEPWNYSTDSNGVAVFKVMAGQYIIRNIFKPGYQILEVNQPVTASGDKKQRLAFQLGVRLGAPDDIAGVVTDKSGQPVAGVTIYIVPGDAPAVATDAQGRFTVQKQHKDSAHSDSRRPSPMQQADYQIVAQDTVSNRGELARVPNNGQPVNITLSDGFELSGRVVDKNGQAIAAAFVTLSLPSSSIALPGQSPQKMVVFEQSVDTQGNFHISGIPYGSGYTISAAADGFGTAYTWVNAGRFMLQRPAPNGRMPQLNPPPGMNSSQRPNVTVMTPDIRTAQLPDFVLAEAKQSISGIVVDSAGRPVPKVIISPENTGSNAFEPVVTDQNGKFNIAGVVEGTIAITAALPWVDDIGTIAPPESCKVAAGTTDVRIILSLYDFPTENNSLPPQHGRVEVRVVDTQSQKPVKGVSVDFASSIFANQPDIVTDEKGMAYIILPAGQHKITSLCGNETYGRHSIDRPIDVVAGQTCHVDLTLESKPAISGIVRDEAGKPVNQAQIRLTPHASSELDVTTSADGTYRITVNRNDAKDYKNHIYLVASHLRRNLSALILLPETLTGTVDIVLQPAPYLTGTITDENGKPIAGADLKIEPQKTSQPTTNYFIPTEDEIRTDMQGKYTIRALPPLPPDCKYEVSFSADSFSDGHIDIMPNDLTAGQATVKNITMSNRKQRPSK